MQSHPASRGQPVRHVGDDGGNRIHAASPARPADAAGGDPLGRAEADREARALVRQHPLGHELVVMVGQDIGWSRVYRPHEDRQALDTMAGGCLQDFLRLDWQRVV